MILNISDLQFKELMNDSQLYLPIRWDGVDFRLTLKEHLECYIQKLEYVSKKGFEENTMLPEIRNIKKVSGLLVKAVSQYLNGFPSKAYTVFKNAMDILMQNPLKIYEESAMEQFWDMYNNELELYRVVGVDDNRAVDRKRVFHTPYNLRAKVSTSRYSIAGYPSLYLGTCLELCCEEIHLDTSKQFALAARFELECEEEYADAMIQVIELGVKPQDFVAVNQDNINWKRRIPRNLLGDAKVRNAYLRWYPLIAACSFVRINKKDPFAAEYILPQLLMQWVRSEMNVGDSKGKKLVGIRYFSCASIKASEMGFNYVFPTSGEDTLSNNPYCKVLSKAFRLSEPVFMHEYNSMEECERDLRRRADLQFIKCC